MPTCTVYTDEECFVYIDINICLCIYTYQSLLKCLFIPSVPQLQKLYLHLKLCVGRIRSSFYIVIVQKVKNILKAVFVVMEKWSHLLLTLFGYNKLCQLKFLKWIESPFIMWGIHSFTRGLLASVILNLEKGRTPGICAPGTHVLWIRDRHLKYPP